MSLKISLFVDVKRKVCMRISTHAILNKTAKISLVVFMPTTNHSVTVGPRGRCIKSILHFQPESNEGAKCTHKWKTQRLCFPHVACPLGFMSINVFLCFINFSFFFLHLGFLANGDSPHCYNFVIGPFIQYWFLPHRLCHNVVARCVRCLSRGES